MISSVSSSPTKKARCQFLWRRLTLNHREFSSIKLVEDANMPVLRMMLTMNQDDPSVQANARRMEEYEKQVFDKQQKYSFYHQKTLQDVAEGYEGARQIGRSYSASQLNHMSRKIVNTMYKMSHREVDIQCCFPTMLWNAFGHLRLPALSVWVENPASTVASIAAETGVGASDVKRALLSVIFSVPLWSTGLLDETKNMEMRRHKFVQGLVSDLGVITTEMKILYSGFYKTMKMKAEQEDKAKHMDGVALFYLASDMEHAVMRDIIESCDPATNSMVWYFDGVLVPNKLIVNEEEACKRFADVAHDKHGIQCVFRVKDISENSIAWSLGPMELSPSSYAAWKHQFEREWFVVEHPAKFGRMFDGRIQLVGKDDFKLITAIHGEGNIKQWLSDPQQRRYRSMEFAPPPFTVKPRNFNTWAGFAAETLPAIENKDDVLHRAKPFLDHCTMLMGNDRTTADYFVKLFAIKIQKPGFRWGIMPVIMSSQGVGKDQFFLFISKIVGPNYCYTGQGFADIVGTSTGLINDRLFVCMSEMSAEDSFKNCEKVKLLITADEITVEEKYVQPYQNRSTVCFLGFSNNFNCIRVRTDDRRFLPVVADSSRRNDATYHGPFNTYINDPVNQRAVFQYLRDHVDISGFEPMRDRPITQTHLDLSTEATSFGDIFVQTKLKEFIAMARGGSSPTSFRMLNDGATVRVSSSILGSYAETFFTQDMKISNLNTRKKCFDKLVVCLKETSSRAERYPGVPGNKPIQQHRSKKDRHWDFDIISLRQYLETELNGNEEADLDATHESFVPPAPAVPPPSPMKAFYNKPGEYPKYVIKQHAVVVFSSNDLEEINKALGEAYITQKADGSWVLVHQYRDNREYPLTEDEAQNKGKVEMKYPWYVRNRCHTV